MNDTVMVDWKTDGYSSLFEDSQLSGFLFFQSDSRIHPYKNQSDLNIATVTFTADHGVSLSFNVSFGVS